MRGCKGMKKGCRRQTALLLTGALLWNLPVGMCADLSLDQAIQMALQQNTDIKIKQKGEETADAALRQAKGAKGFSITATGGADSSKANSEDITSKLSAGITAKLPIYSAGKLDNNIASGELGVKSAVLGTAREQEDIRLSVIKAYYDVIESRKTIDVDQDAVDKYQAHLTNTQQLYSAGSKARIDVLRASVELSNNRQTLIKAQNSYEVKLANLRNILNMDRNEPLNLTDDVLYTPFDKDINSCVDYAYDNRKDLLADKYTLEQKELAIKVAEAGMKPTVDLSVGSNLSSQIAPSSSDSHSFTAGLSASWNVFDSGITHAKIDSAKTDRDIARLQLNKDMDNADYSVREAYYNMREAEKRFNSTQEAVQQAKEDYYIAREKYRAGEGIMLDVIDAQNSLVTAELNYITAQYDYARYKATLENAMGIGLTAQEQAAAGVPATKIVKAENEAKTKAPAVPEVPGKTVVQEKPAEVSPANVEEQSENVANEAAENGGE